MTDSHICVIHTLPKTQNVSSPERWLTSFSSHLPTPLSGYIVPTSFAVDCFCLS